ncbi:MAG: HAMP domain-containing histidine kinase [Sporocytophaga sp.]|nr:HAMP domain-containing histidine kinase [Sporocytophaga sp.]
MEFTQLRTLDIYQNRSKFKLIILIIAVVIGTVSIYYTQSLVNKLAEREKKLIDLYAKGLKTAISPENSGGLTFLFQEIIEANNSVPVILTDENKLPISEKNLFIPDGLSEAERIEFMKIEISEMEKEHEPIVVEFGPGLKNYIFYKNSYLLTQLVYYPFIQLTVIAIFAIIAYLAFSYSRNAEQNRVWVGLAKETAHQLGTPLSSLMAWLELLKSNPKYEGEEALIELDKDIVRLEMITARFSNIGSVPTLSDENVYQVVKSNIDYLKPRISSKVIFSIISDVEVSATAKINKPLFEWVIENICKNATDAMNGVGRIDIRIVRMNDGKIAIDISDTGKGIPRSKAQEIFKPGYTTKKRGWGLGLTLVKRIVENYHNGKIFVLFSELGKGTTFRIILNS